MELARPALTDLPFRRGATVNGCRAFQRPHKRRTIPFRRIATIDGSRGFQPTEIGGQHATRREATIESRRGIAPYSAEFNCRSATNHRGYDANRGMNAPATIRRSLRDEDIELAAKIQENFEGLGI